MASDFTNVSVCFCGREDEEEKEEEEEEGEEEEETVWPLETKKKQQKTEKVWSGAVALASSGPIACVRGRHAAMNSAPLICTRPERWPHPSPQPPHLRPGVLMCSKDAGITGILRKKQGTVQLMVPVNSGVVLSLAPWRMTRAVMEGARDRSASHTTEADMFCVVTSDNSMNTQKSTCVLSLCQGRVNGRWGPSTARTLPPRWISGDESCCVRNWATWIKLTSGPFDGGKLYTTAKASAGG